MNWVCVLGIWHVEVLRRGCIDTGGIIDGCEEEVMHRLNMLRGQDGIEGGAVE